VKNSRINFYKDILPREKLIDELMKFGVFLNTNEKTWKISLNMENIY